MKFTDNSIKGLKPKAARYEVWDGEGFGVRVSPHGVKTWVWVYRHHGRTRRLTLGTYPAMSLADANVRLAGARQALERGEDPATVAVAERKADRAAETISELVDQYLEKWARPRKRSASEDERILNKDVRPAWGSRKAKDITRRDVIALLDKIVSRGAPIAANRTLATIRRMFNWAVSRDLLPANPCSAIEAPGEEARRDRVLTADEIAALWRALDNPDLAMSTGVRLALKLQLVTAQRKGEVIGAEWSEFDVDGDKVWTIPGDKTKNGMAHRVPLSAAALDVLAEIRAEEEARRKRAASKKRKRRDVAEPELPPASRWLFPSRSGDKPLTGPGVDHAMRDNRAELGTGDATPHDLRRTAASHMTSIGISRLVVSKILNHAEPGVIAVYDRHSYDAEKRQALDAWALRLTAIVAGEARPAPTNVVNFARA